MLNVRHKDHARRQFIDLLSHFPDEVDDVLAQYKLIWNHDDHTKKAQMNPSERLGYHREHSLPVMECKKINAQGRKKANFVSDSGSRTPIPENQEKCSSSAGMGVRLESESVFGFVRNECSRSPGIRNCT